MTTTSPSSDPASLAAHARSILSCPEGVSLVVEGAEYDLDEGVSLHDDAGTPTFFAPFGCTVDRAAGENRNALLRVTGRLDADNEVRSHVVLAGTLRVQGECCHEDTLRVVTLEIGMVSLVLTGDGHPERHLTVPTSQFRHPAHRLNRGYLHSCAQHANECHQDELLRAVALATGTPLGQLAGVTLADLRPAGVSLRWIDASGSHSREIAFSVPARNPEELAGLLSAHLHSDLC
ncbi:hypothetical protein [Nocardioides sp. Root151]|uniref:hypothetical protein n=1 Tax=Nocardioides sp. Root151 TaxID=1736475 RepID=UPI0007032914|nr:hypothetical protein [Nocardioides sp. Root151]KQZ66459.1 hypothetical protein ASD66_23335 [Nocardioides sp. Root151]